MAWAGPALNLLFRPHTPRPHRQCLAQELVSQKSLHCQGPDALVPSGRQQPQPSVCRVPGGTCECCLAGGLPQGPTPQPRGAPKCCHT